MSESRSRAGFWRTVVLVIVAALAVMWVYVLFIANPESTEDKLHETTFATAAEPVCHTTLDLLNQLGVVNKTAASPQERADLVDRTDTELLTMLQRLRTFPVPNGEDEHAVSQWLDDWSQWLRDRAVWSEKLHRGEDAPFLEKQRNNGEPNSKALNDFARINSMPSCATPGGV